MESCSEDELDSTINLSNLTQKDTSNKCSDEFSSGSDIEMPFSPILDRNLMKMILVQMVVFNHVVMKVKQIFK